MQPGAIGMKVACVTACVLLVGWTVELPSVEPVHPLPEGAPGLIVHGGEGLEGNGPVSPVVFLHGWNGCVRTIVHAGAVPCRPGARPLPGWGLAAAHAAAGTRTLLVVPQLAWRARDGSPGRLRDTTYAAKLLARAKRAAAEHLDRSVALGPITLVAHSAGYETALALLDWPAVRHVVLLDALYAGHGRFAAWLAEGGQRRLVSMHIGRGKPHRHSRHLARQVRRELGSGAVTTIRARAGWERAMGRRRLTVVQSAHGHGALPRRHLAEVVRGLHGQAPP